MSALGRLWKVPSKAVTEVLRRGTRAADRLGKQSCNPDSAGREVAMDRVHIYCNHGAHSVC